MTRPVALALTLLVVLGAASARAADSAIPLVVNHSGRLLSAGDVPVEGTASLVFKLYAVPGDLDPSAPTAALWTGRFDDVPVTRGLYTVELGSKTAEPMAPSVFDGSGPRWLGISVNGSAELTPRLRVASTAFAYLAGRALDADRLAGKTSAHYLDAANLTGTLSPAVLPLATTQAAGAMSAADKTKLDGLQGGALLDALDATLPLSILRGARTTLSLAAATASTDGAMSAADKAKLDAIGAGARITAVTGSGAIAVTGTTSLTIGLGDATTLLSGAMSAADKLKLDGIGAGAKITGVAGTGPISVTGTTGLTVAIADATTTTPGAMSAADKLKLNGIVANAGVATGTARPANPSAGMLYLDSVTRALDVYDGVAWRNLSRPVSTTCKQLKQIDPSAPSGIYVVRPNAAVGDLRVYCEMSVAGGGWTLVANRRANSLNIESCGANLAEFFNSGCNTVDTIGYAQSYSMPPNQRAALGQAEVLFMQYENGNGVPDLDDAYVMTVNASLFPNDTGMQNLPITKVCDVNGSNCFTNNVFFKWVGNSYYANTSCNSGITTGTYGGNYGLCHTGVSSAYNSSAAYGNREEYQETKLWNYTTAANVQERIFVR